MTDNSAWINAATAAANYKGRGWKPVPIPLGEKGPRGNKWQDRDYNPARDFDAKNVGVQLGPVSNGLTDR